MIKEISFPFRVSEEVPQYKEVNRRVNNVIQDIYRVLLSSVIRSISLSCQEITGEHGTLIHITTRETK